MPAVWGFLVGRITCSCPLMPWRNPEARAWQNISIICPNRGLVDLWEILWHSQENPGWQIYGCFSQRMYVFLSFVGSLMHGYVRYNVFVYSRTFVNSKVCDSVSNVESFTVNTPAGSTAYNSSPVKGAQTQPAQHVITHDVWNWIFGLLLKWWALMSSLDDHFCLDTKWPAKACNRETRWFSPSRYWIWVRIIPVIRWLRTC